MVQSTDHHSHGTAIASSTHAEGFTFRTIPDSWGSCGGMIDAGRGGSSFMPCQVAAGNRKRHCGVMDPTRCWSCTGCRPSSSLRPAISSLSLDPPIGLS